MGVSGSVEHSYSHLSHITLKGMDEEEVLETLLMADLDILELEEVDGQVEIEGNGFDLDKIQEALKEAKDSIEIIDAEKGWYPSVYIELDEVSKEAFQKMMDLLNEVEDVQEIFHNAKDL